MLRGSDHCMRQGGYAARACLNGMCKIPEGIRGTLMTQVGPRHSCLLWLGAAVQGGGAMSGQHALPAWLCVCARTLARCMCRTTRTLCLAPLLGAKVLPWPCQEQWACWRAKYGPSS